MDGIEDTELEKIWRAIEQLQECSAYLLERLEKRGSASRANGKKGGRPRKKPTGFERNLQVVDNSQDAENTTDKADKNLQVSSRACGVFKDLKDLSERSEDSKKEDRPPGWRENTKRAFGHVWLTEPELAKIKSLYAKELWQLKMRELATAIENCLAVPPRKRNYQHKRTLEYTDHFKTVKNWCERDAIRNPKLRIAGSNGKVKTAAGFVENKR